MLPNTSRHWFDFKLDFKLSLLAELAGSAAARAIDPLKIHSIHVEISLDEQEAHNNSIINVQLRGSRTIVPSSVQLHQVHTGQGH